MKVIDIVIPCAGRVNDLLRLLASLERHCEANLPQVASITATDDRHDPSLGAQIAQSHPNVHYVAGPSRGPATNRNNGARQGQAEWILFLDDDCYLEADLLSAYGACIAAQPVIDVFEGAIHSVGERPNGNHHAPINTTGGVLWSCNLLIKRRVFEAVGCFDEAFPFACMEDVDLRERLKAAGVRVGFAPNAMVLHPWRSISEREVTRQIISHAIYAAKHPQFVREWTPLHALRMAKGRLWLYAAGGFGSIPWAKYRTVAYDLMAPFALLAVTRVAPLRRSVDRRFRHGHPQSART